MHISCRHRAVEAGKCKTGGNLVEHITGRSQCVRDLRGRQTAHLFDAADQYDIVHAGRNRHDAGAQSYPTAGTRVFDACRRRGVRPTQSAMIGAVWPWPSNRSLL